MSGLPYDTTVLLRSGNKSKPGLFERVMAMACQELWWFSLEWWRPDPARGREATYHRDYDMVRSADLVLAYFSGDELIGGTGHIVQAAIDAERPCYAYGLRAGGFVRLHDWDEHDVWRASVPKP